MQFNPAFAVLIGLVLAAAPAADAQTDDACARAVKAQSTGGADYKPGVDVYGRPVAPADAQPTLRIEPPQVIEFPVTLDVAKRLGFDARGPYEAKTTVANVRIDNGRVTVNGQVVHTDNEADLIAACRAARR
ncbi:hypothetical protein [Oleispirillum naphthae]|uniref:hypothetical protein n=1 Tax=Oleispirillum naphthae TaxID=2838853 RepID=UPI00308252D9